MAELTPMKKQYLEIKSQHPDCLLFFRLGDFYEMFDDDAKTAAAELNLTLTTRDRNKPPEQRTPMCGVPYHSAEAYIGRLIAKGYKVAICEQVEDPAKAKGLVKRDIIRVVTPGTVIESSMLQDDRNNYIASLYLKGKKAGLCFADVSTGTAHITELTADKIAPAVITELCRYHPSEVLLNPGLLDCREVTAYIKKNMSCSVELVEDERYAPGLVASALEEQFGRDWPQTTGMVAEGLVRFAMAALLEYLHDTQIKGVERLKTVITYNEAQFMRLSQVTRANLELTETLRGRERRFANKGDILHVELVEHGETFLECAAAHCDGQVPSIIGSWGARLRAARKPKGNGESARARRRDGELCACEDGPWSCAKPERGFSRGTRAIKKPARLSGL